MSLSEHGIYQRYTDNVARDADLSIAIGTDPGDANYGPDTLVDDNPAKVAKIDSTTGGWLIDSGGPVDVQLAALINHTFDEGADVRLLASNTLADLTGSPMSPTFSASFTIPAWLASGSRRWSVNPWIDLTQQSGYDAAGFRYRLLLVTGNSQNIQLGQLWLGSTIRRFDPDVRWGVTRGYDKPIVENVTSARVSHIVSRMTTLWDQSGEILDASDELYAALEAHYFDVGGRELPWLLVPDGAINKCFMVRYAATRHQMQWNFPTVRNLQIVVQEVSRGLRPGV